MEMHITSLRGLRAQIPTTGDVYSREVSAQCTSGTRVYISHITRHLVRLNALLLGGPSSLQPPRTPLAYGRALRGGGGSCKVALYFGPVGTIRGCVNLVGRIRNSRGVVCGQH